MTLSPHLKIYRQLSLLLIPAVFFHCSQPGKSATMISDIYTNSVIEEMVEKFDKSHNDRINVGVKQVQEFWLPQDGDREAFRTFCLQNFITDSDELNLTLKRLEWVFENLNGHLLELNREFQWHLDVNTGPILAIDQIVANFNLASHVEEDLYNSKIGFFVLLNYPVHSLKDYEKYGQSWSRQKWAEARLASQFTSRVPADVSQAIFESYVTAGNYINNYNIFMYNLLDQNSERLFPEGLTLISHWGLRDELKSQYDDPEGLPRQRIIYEVMQKIIKQEIPVVVINNPDVDWNVSLNTVSGESTDSKPEPNTRYETLRKFFQNLKASDPYYPLYPNAIDRRFNLEREIPEETVRTLFTSLLASDEFLRTGQIIRQRLKRDLEPFDIWYTGFRKQSELSESELDEITLEKYPTADAFKLDISNILQSLGFDHETAGFLQSKIEVDPARGAGHAMGAERRADNAHLRTRVSATGMNYKGFNIAMHELGHTVEQVFSLNRIDYPLLQGVPNNAFTEAFAFIFQNRNLDILELEESTAGENPLAALNRLWSVCEIAGVSLVDIDVWHWMYDHPGFTAQELKTAVIGIARDIWNEYFYPIIGHRDAPILAIYSHMIDYPMYLPDYPIGHIIEFQIEEYLHDKSLAREMERMCTLGNLTPEQWMIKAVGEKISIDPILVAVREALKSAE